MIGAILACALAAGGCRGDDAPQKPEVSENVTEEEGPKKDVYGRAYDEDGNITIPSEELRNMVIDVWTKWSLQDSGCIDGLYLKPEHAQALKKLMDSEQGKTLLSKMTSTFDISADGIPATTFTARTLDADGNSIQTEDLSNILITGVSYENFLDVMRAKFDAPISTPEELFAFIDRYNEYYPARYRGLNAISFVYQDGKAKIDGESFLQIFGIFRDHLAGAETVMDLVRDAYAEPVENGSFYELPELLREGDFIQAYEFLRRNDLIGALDYDPSEALRNLYALPEDIRAAFKSDMSQLPRPLVKVFRRGEETDMLVIYYYPDHYGVDASGDMLESAFTAHSLTGVRGLMFERIVNNLLMARNVKVT